MAKSRRGITATSTTFVAMTSEMITTYTFLRTRLGKHFIQYFRSAALQCVSLKSRGRNVFDRHFFRYPVHQSTTFRSTNQQSTLPLVFYHIHPKRFRKRQGKKPKNIPNHDNRTNTSLSRVTCAAAYVNRGRRALAMYQTPVRLIPSPPCSYRQRSVNVLSA